VGVNKRDENYERELKRMRKSKILLSESLSRVVRNGKRRNRA
jgi:hypothetical protein